LKPLKQRCHYSGGATPLKPLEPLNRRYTIEAIEAAYRDGFGLMRWVQWGYIGLTTIFSPSKVIPFLFN
jgi:hypothetical protein